jgi:hypothetical protein
MVCRGMLLMLERAGQITLPPVSYVRHNPLAHRARPEPVLIDKTPIEDRLRKLQPLEFEQVRRTAREPLFNSLMEEHHYLGYEQPVGEHLKYLVWAEAVRSHAWPGHRLRVILAAVIATSDGTQRRGAAASVLSPTTRAS